ncbi:MAG: S8 family peptidase [Desulfobacterales bacterium]
MRWVTRLLAVGLMVCIAQLGMVPPAEAGKGNKAAKIERKKQIKENRFEKRRKDRRIVMFAEGVTHDGRMAYVADWSHHGVKLVKELPLINGAVLWVPRGLDNDSLTNDERVSNVVNNQGTRLKNGRQADRLRMRDADSGSELVYISGDGGSGDGGSGDGGSGDGGSGDGGSTLSPMFRIVNPLGEAEKPWGILDLYDHPYDPEWLTLTMDSNQLPEIMQTVLGFIEELINYFGNYLTLKMDYSPSTRVAILDTGVNYMHPDLAGAIAGGADMVGTDSGIPMDNHGHGTHVAGTIVSEHAGVAPNKAEIYAVRILNDDGSGEVATLLMGLEWAIQNQMDIISMSVSYRTDDPAVYQAVQTAYNHGIIMVAAAGNHSNWEDDDTSSGDGGSGDGGSGDGGSGDGGSLAYDALEGIYPVMYPAAYPEVIAVGAMDSWEQVAAFSNTGPEVDVLAPGVDVISTVGADGYALCNGTSMAAPHVTAAVVLMKAEAIKNGLEITPDQAKEILKMTTYNGTINLTGALEVVQSGILPVNDFDLVVTDPLLFY